MNRNAGTMVLCLALGAVVMYGSTNFRIHVEQVAPPGAKATPPPAPGDEPDRLPKGLIDKRGGDRPYTDPHVRPTGALLAPTDPPVESKIAAVTETIASQTVRWDTTRFREIKLGSSTSGTVTLAISPKPDASDALDVYIDRTKIDPAAVGITVSKEQDQLVIALSDKLPPARFQIGIGVRKATVPNSTQRDAIDLVRSGPVLPSGGAAVIAAKYQNAPFAADLNQFLDVNTATAVEVFGGYLRLKGQAFVTSPQLTFFKVISQSAFTVDAAVKPVTPNGEWDAELALGPNATGTGYVLTRVEGSTGHYYASAAVSFDPKPALKPDVPRFDANPIPPAALLDPKSTATPTVYRVNALDLTSVTVTPPTGAQSLLLFANDQTVPAQVEKVTGATAVVFKPVKYPNDGNYIISVAAATGKEVGPRATLALRVRTQGPTVASVSAPGFGNGGDKETITVRFSGEELDPKTVIAANFVLTFNAGATAPEVPPVDSTPTYSPVTNTVLLKYDSKKIVPGEYTLTIKNKDKDGSGGVQDIYGNALRGPRNLDKGDNIEAKIIAIIGSQALPSQQAGVTLQTGPPVDYPIYLSPPKYPEGFNPSDRAESRVVRLYYYRDAHRVAQLINRSVKSFNAATVDVRRRAADRVRDDANKAEDDRKRLEFQSVKAAQEARSAEAELNNLQNRATAARGQATQARTTLDQLQFRLSQVQNDPAKAAEAAQLRSDINSAQQAFITADSIDRQAPADIAAAQSKVAGKREAEAKAAEAMLVKELEERRLRESQFRIEVAAATADPDTYAPGNINSDDPVMRVSISVIGEGLIQIRGPIKGLNVIRTMCNQIDAPVGQVRVSVHTLQVNGEKGDRMEKVVANIQRYLDHSRFLTAQSGQMLRNAVTFVASRKAAEVAATLAPGCTQWDRDQKYLYAFFGKDFTDELTQLDSEFLRTGNKLLALNSMDSTSLSSAIFLMALAKNEVRTEIIEMFLATVQRDLPEAEWKYYVAGISQPKHCDACKNKKEYLLAFNSQFQSFIGFFSAQVSGTDTLNPLQREFIRLAQIFKAQMITEMQLRQRVMERSLLEERINVNYLDELRKAKALEDEAKKELSNVQTFLQKSSAEAFLKLQEILIRLDDWEGVTDDIIAVLDAIDKIEQPGGAKIQDDGSKRLAVKTKTTSVTIVQEANSFVVSVPDELFVGLEGVELIADQFVYLSEPTEQIYIKFKTFMKELRADRRLSQADRTLLKQSLTTLTRLLKGEALAAKSQIQAITDHLTGDRPDPAKAQALYKAFRDDLLNKLREGKPYRAEATQLFNATNTVFVNLANAVVNQQVAAKKAQAARRPLDEKKLLDLLVDEMEDKYVEILESMRAHTSNVDNYLKSVTTALDDDFNTQYYNPSFRRAREASRYWDVTLSQIETTSVLTNNRSLGKVSPAATFEFDLPKRDILITEGFKSAKALVDTYGALVNDPSFIALAKIYSGNPASMMQSGGGGLSSVRNVLPGLGSTPDERILAQQGPGQKQTGTPLDALIPDPAIYKFETGTGYEIRPVLSPDGQAVVFGFDYLYSTDVREPVRADEKHLGRVKRHFVHTDVQLGNFELREVSKYMVSLKVSRTGKGVQLLQDIPGVGILFRPLPSAESSLQQNLIYSQATIFPTLFDLMGLRYAPAVADLDPLADRMSEFAARFRRLDVEQRIYDIGATRVDDALRTPYGERRYDLYRPPTSLPFIHPNGYTGVGLRMYDGTLREGYDVPGTFPDSRFAPGTSIEGRPKPFNYDLPPGADPRFSAPGYGAPMDHNPAHPLGQPHLVPPTGGAVRPTGPGTMQLPGMGAVGVGRPVPYSPALPTTPGRGTEMPATSLPPVVTPGVPTSFPRPQPAALPPVPTYPQGSIR